MTLRQRIEAQIAECDAMMDEVARRTRDFETADSDDHELHDACEAERGAYAVVLRMLDEPLAVELRIPDDAWREVVPGCLVANIDVTLNGCPMTIGAVEVDVEHDEYEGPDDPAPRVIERQVAAYRGDPLLDALHELTDAGVLAKAKIRDRWDYVVWMEPHEE